jgi:hypothetical protein
VVANRNTGRFPYPQRAQIHRLCQYIYGVEDGEKIYILPEHEDHGPLHPSYFSLATDAKGDTRCIVDAGSCDLIFEPGEHVESMEKVFDYALERSLPPPQAAAYLGEVLGQMPRE